MMTTDIKIQMIFINLWMNIMVEIMVNMDNHTMMNYTIKLQTKSSWNGEITQDQNKYPYIENKLFKTMNA